MWGALQDAARTITLLLEKAGEGHRKCPSCRGSGLLGNFYTMPERKGAHPNQPCWFCEGIGSLPIAGLNGFVIARTTRCLRAPDKHTQPCIDSLQLNHSRDSERACKFTNAKLGTTLADLSFDPHKSPWVNCNSLGSQQDVLDNSEAHESIIKPGLSEPKLSPILSFSPKDQCTRNTFFQRILNARLVLSIINSSQPNARCFQAPIASSVPSSAILVPVRQKLAKARPLLKLKGAIATQHASYTQRTSNRSLSTAENEHWEAKFLRHSPTKLQAQTAANVVITKRRRLQRKARNCIRNKAIKERAGGLVNALKSKGEPDLAGPCSQPGTDSEHIMEATSRSWQRLGGHVEHTFPSDMPSSVWLTTVAVVSRQVLLNRLLADGFKVPMPTTPKSM